MIENFEKYLESGWSCWRETISKDARGGVVKAWEKQFDFDGRINKNGGNVKIVNGRETETRLARVYCKQLDIIAGDKLKFGDDAYLVVDPDDVMNFGRLMQVDCEWLVNG